METNPVISMKEGDAHYLLSMFSMETREALTNIQKNDAINIITGLSGKATILDFVKNAEKKQGLKRLSLAVGWVFLDDHKCAQRYKQEYGEKMWASKIS